MALTFRADCLHFKICGPWICLYTNFTELLSIYEHTIREAWHLQNISLPIWSVRSLLLFNIPSCQLNAQQHSSANPLLTSSEGLSTSVCYTDYLFTCHSVQSCSPTPVWKKRTFSFSPSREQTWGRITVMWQEQWRWLRTTLLYLWKVQISPTRTCKQQLLSYLYIFPSV